MNSQNNRSSAPARRQGPINRELEEEEAEAEFIFGQHAQPIVVDDDDSPPVARRTSGRPHGEPNDNAADAPSASVAAPQNVNVS